MKITYSFDSQDDIAEWLNEVLEASSYSLCHREGRAVLFIELPPNVCHSRYNGLYISGPLDLSGLADALEQAKKTPDETELLSIVPGQQPLA